jgi:hypothetical protein
VPHGFGFENSYSSQMYPGYPTNYVGVPQNVSYPIQANPYGQPTYQVQTQFVQPVSPSPQPNYQVTSYGTYHYDYFIY